MNARTSIALLKATGIVALVACAFGVAPAFAQDAPSYATAPDAIRGTIAALPGRFALVLDDERGFRDSVTLHDGTEIQPQGVTLQIGQAVTIIGHVDGKTFAADEIDTDGADTSSGYDTAPAEPYAGPPDGGGYAGSSYGYGGYAGGIYPPYVIPLGGSAYYYGSGAYGGGIYYDGGSQPNHPRRGAPGYAPVPVIRSNPVSHGAPVVRGQLPVVGPIVRSHGTVAPVRTAPVSSASRAYAPAARSAPAVFRSR